MDYQELDRLISELEEKVEDAERGGCTWKEVWSDVGHIGAQFKGTWYPTRDDKDAAWARFQEMVQRIKARREEHRERSEQRRRESEDKREDWTRKAEVSARHKEEIVSHARSGRPPSGLEEMLAGVVLLPLEAIVRTVTLGHGSILPEHREQLRYWSQRIREAWDLFKEHKEEILGRDRKELFDKLKEEQAACDRAWERLKGAQANAREAREHEREKRHQRHDEWRERMEAKIDRLNALVEKNEGIIERLRGQIDDLEDKVASAWNEDWAERARGWIGEKYDKIRDIESTNRELEAKIEDIKSQLRE